MIVHGFNKFGFIRVSFDDEHPEQVSVVPDAPGNLERKLIAEWEKDGNTIPSYEEPPALLGDITARQIRLGLIGGGIMLADVDSAIESIADPTDRETARIEWQYASSFRRDHPLIAMVGNQLGLTEQQIDDMWQQAAQL